MLRPPLEAVFVSFPLFPPLSEPHHPLPRPHTQAFARLQPDRAWAGDDRNQRQRMQQQEPPQLRRLFHQLLGRGRGEKSRTGEVVEQGEDRGLKKRRGEEEQGCNLGGRGGGGVEWFGERDL